MAAGTFAAMPPTRSRVLAWSALSGLLWALAWPAIGGLTPLAFVAWLPLLQAERLHEQRTPQRPRAFYPYALLGFLLWNALCSYWFYLVSEPFGTKVLSVGFPVIGNTLLMGIPWWFRRAVKQRLGARWGHLALIAGWLAFERLHHDWDLQWPWFALGNVFGTRPQWVQWYELTGMLGGSLWVIAVNLLLFEGLQTWRTARAQGLRLLGAGMVVVVLPLGASRWRYHAYPLPEQGGVEVVVVQPNIDPYKEKFGGVDPLAQLDRMLALAEGAMTEQTRLVVFPETALQEPAAIDGSSGDLVFHGLWENDLPASRSVQRLKAFQALHPQSALLLGMSSDRWFKGDGDRPSTARPIRGSAYWYESYNAALWMPAQGDAEAYHKSKLVAGVELMPFEEVLGPLGEFAMDMGGTTGSLGQQRERSVLRDGASGLAVIPAICYESVFGEHLAAHARNGGTLIAVMTNDGWWGDSPGYRQHLAFSSLRAIELRRDVVRSANTGISCIVDQRGAIRQATGWWVPTAFSATVHPNAALTFFARHGDLIGRAALGVASAFLLALLALRLRRPQ